MRELCVHRRLRARLIPSPPQPEAVVFDFDGTILDTETPLFEAWSDTYRHFGVEPIGLDLWVRSLGLPSNHPDHLNRRALLEELMGRSLTEADEQIIAKRMVEQCLDEQPLRPGVVDVLDQAQELGLGVALASSSPRDWIERHLEPRGLLDRFTFLSCAGPGVPGKPDPTTYRMACEALDVDPVRSVALEDSPTGVKAANSAGLTTIACPNPISRLLDFSHADRIVESLVDVDLRSFHESIQ